MNRTAAPPNARITDEGWFTPLKPKSPPPELPADITRAFVIEIHGEINPTMLASVRRKVAHCKGKGAQIVIFDMDTPGGRLDVTQEIVKLIMDDLSNIYTVAYINPNAFSAGAILSIACNEIVMSSRGKIGAAMGILVKPGGVEELPGRVRGKLDSAARSEMRVLASQRGYSPLLCEGMVCIDLVIWLTRNTKTGQLKFNAENWAGIGVGNTPTTLPAKKRIPPPEVGWELVRVIDWDRELITLTADEAMFCGFAKHISSSQNDLLEYYNISTKPVVLGATWSEKLVAFLASPMVSGLLMILGLMALWSEGNSPGLGVPAVVAVLCFGVLFGSHYLVGLANWWEIGLFIVGVVLLAAEIFVIPGFGVAGISGILCCIVALLAMWIPNAPSQFPIPQTGLDWSIFRQGIFVMLVSMVVTAVVISLLVRHLPRLPLASQILLPPPDVSDSAPTTNDAPIRSIEQGSIGIVIGTCRPVGHVRIDGKLVDAIANGNFIPTGKKVRVIKKEGNRLVVEQEEE